jgi:hypothetical protein
MSQIRPVKLKITKVVKKCLDVEGNKDYQHPDQKRPHIAIVLNKMPVRYSLSHYVLSISQSALPEQTDLGFPAASPMHDFQGNLFSTHVSSPHDYYLYEFRPSLSP